MQRLVQVAMMGFFMAGFLGVGPAMASDNLDGRSLSFTWAIPFIGLLLSMALAPLFLHRTWEHHYGKIAAGWALLVLIPMAALLGTQVTLEAFLFAIFVEYMPFIILLFTLYTVSGGILVTGNFRGTTPTNVVILLIGTFLASFVGTTGASMIMIRPLIRANDDRVYNMHVVIFFIFLVSNVGGALTPLGDPPLFVGFLRGVDFFWTTKHLLIDTVLAVGILIGLFVLADTYFHRKENRQPHPADKTPDRDLKIYGKFNFVLLAGVIVAILLSAYWRPGIDLHLPGATLPLQGLVRDGLLLTISALSLILTPKQVRAGNEFSWGAILEVAKLFAAIFVAVIPVIAILKAGPNGAMASLVALVSHADGSPNIHAYYFLTGALSSFLDNAPTYLVFFELAGGDPKTLMTTGAEVLKAISLGAVFMGANTYIGNAPNLMVATIARDMGVKMPSFVGYMLWSGAILMPVLLLIGFVML